MQGDARRLIVAMQAARLLLFMDYLSFLIFAKSLFSFTCRRPL